MGRLRHLRRHRQMSLLQHASSVSSTGALNSRTQLQLNATRASKSTKELALELVCRILSLKLSHGIVMQRLCRSELGCSQAAAPGQPAFIWCARVCFFLAFLWRVFHQLFGAFLKMMQFQPIYADWP